MDNEPVDNTVAAPEEDLGQALADLHSNVSLLVEKGIKPEQRTAIAKAINAVNQKVTTALG
jgi:hypothetical protein